jgi:hypothetical protein
MVSASYLFADLQIDTLFFLPLGVATLHIDVWLVQSFWTAALVFFIYDTSLFLSENVSGCDYGPGTGAGLMMMVMRGVFMYGACTLP